MRNWLFLTGSLSALRAVWEHYGIAVQIGPAGAMAAHSDLAYLIDARGYTREVLSTEPGNGSASSSSFSVYLAAALDRVAHT
jgi:cytochrome oxidase Cu insertion factor (SCO1/SenC/PrrC family)